MSEALDQMQLPPIPAFPRRAPAQNPGPLTLLEYGREKGLAADWLRELGITEDDRGVCIPYRDEQGAQMALRWRLRADAPTRFLWEPGAQPLPYGLWLPLNRQAGGLILVEGESDTHSLWRLDLPGLGIPGAATFRPEWAQTLRDGPCGCIWRAIRAARHFLRARRGCCGRVATGGPSIALLALIFSLSART